MGIIQVGGALDGLTIDHRDRDIAMLATIIIAVFAVCLASKGISAFGLISYLTNLIMFGYVAVAWFIVRVLKILLVDRPEAPTRKIAKSFFSRSKLPRYISALAVLMCLVAFMPAFSAMKSAVPMFNNYTWDNYFINLDRQIHGDDAWKVLQPLIGYPIVTSILSGFYHIWLILLYVGSFYFVINKRPELRQRYFLSYFLCWSIIGAGLAIVFASVGPCFVEPILGRDDFIPLLQYLRKANQSYPVLVLDVQNMLLARFQNTDSNLGSGITAMPSMHVAHAFLLFLAMRHVSRLATWLFGVFFLIIFIGSVHLAYHYAVDGYLSIIITGLVWKLSGWWAARGNALTAKAWLEGEPGRSLDIARYKA